MYRGIRLSAIGVTLSALVALSGCSGSSDAPSVAAPSVPPSPSKAPGGRLSMDEDVQPQRVAAAQAIPRAGSVTQSSDAGTVGVVDNTTLDRVNVVVREDSDGNLHVRVTYNGDEAVDTEDAEARKYVEHVHGKDPGTQFFERFEDDDFKAVEFYRSLADGDVSDLPAGDLWVDVYTDFGVSGVDETDYLAGGIWVFVPEDGGADDYEFGAFADGVDPFEGQYCRFGG